MSQANKILSKQAAGLLGTGLSIFGVTAILMVLSQLKNPVAVALIIVGSGCLSIGTWVSTVARAMTDSPADDSADKT